MPPPSPVHLLPAEILSIIFLLVIDDLSERVQLMRVCRHWYAIMLSTPGILSGLWIRKSTTLDMVRASIQGTRWLLGVGIDIDDEGIEQDPNAGAFDTCFTAAIEVASRWEYLGIFSLPRPRKCKTFQIVPPLKGLKVFYLGQGCDLVSFFEPLMTAITTTATPQLTIMGLRNLNAVLYLVQPHCLHVFCSLTTLKIWLSKRMENSVNILPHLQRLERFTARHLHLPNYPHDTHLPLIQTLHYLHLKSVSVQWMAGKDFSVLQTCNITFPHHIDTICLQPVTMPACTSLAYESNDLGPLGYFYNLPLTALTVKSGQWNVRRGNLQLIPICHIALPHAQSLIRLDLQVRCSEQLLGYMLSLLPALKILNLRLASPRALNEAFFKKFVATKSNTDSPCGMGALPSLPLCLKLVELDVKYRRWLRGPERMALLLVFGDVVSSRRLEGAFRLCLSVEDFAQDWFICRHIESIHEAANDEPFMIGVPSQHKIIPLVPGMSVPGMEVPFQEAEYLVACRDELSIECLSTLHYLVELRVGGEDDILPSEPPPNLPLFHTLKVLVVENIHHSFLAGQTFHKLQKCRMSGYGEDPDLSKDWVTQMPVCTRLDVANLTLLATLKLPQIRELGVSFDHSQFNMIWEKHIAVNANLSGLELLHVYGWYQQADLIQVLRSLPVLKSLIIGNASGLHAGFFREFVPIHQNWLSMLVMSHYEDRISLLCPMLRSLLIEGFDPTEKRELIPILKEIVILRAVCGYHLERFTFSVIKLGRKCELIGSQGGVVTEMHALEEGVKPFRLNV